MKKVSSAVVVSLVAGVAAAAIVLNASDPDPVEQGSAAVNSHFDDQAATEQRILALEAAVSEEREARQLLEDELLLLFAEFERLESSREESEIDQQGGGTAEAVVLSRSQDFRSRRSTTGRRDAMIAAGMSPDRVDWILQRESELRFESMQARYDARNSDQPQNPFDSSFNPEAMLRAEIGDAEYESYLTANNRSTSVGVSSVMASSPGERAGLRPGDEIVGYDGQRVFSSSDLVQRTMAGGEGIVVVDVMRDGAPMQIVVPRGPIGVEIGRFRGR